MTATPTEQPQQVSLAERLGWRARERPATGFGHVLAATAGFFAVVSVIAFAIEVTGDDPTVPGVVATLALALVAAFVGAKVGGPTRAACVTAIVLCTPAVWAFAFFGGGDVTIGNLRGVYALTMVVYFVAYLVGWTRGRAILLGLALLTFATLVTSLISDQGSGTPVVPTSVLESSGSTDLPFGTDSPFETDSSPSFETTTTDDSSEQSIAALLIGIGFLAAAAALDRRGSRGAATPFLFVGAIEAIAGAAVLGGTESAALGGVLAALAGAAVALVAIRGKDRRASVWIGIIVVAIGLLVVIVDGASSSALAVGEMSLVIALLLGAGAVAVATRLHEASDGEPGETIAPPADLPTGANLNAWIAVAVAAIVLLICSVAFDWFSVGFDSGSFSVDEGANAWVFTLTGIAVVIGGVAGVAALLRLGGYRIPALVPLALGAASMILIAIKLIVGPEIDTGGLDADLDESREIGIYLGLVASAAIVVASALVLRTEAATPVRAAEADTTA